MERAPSGKDLGRAIASLVGTSRLATGARREGRPSLRRTLDRDRPKTSGAVRDEVRTSLAWIAAAIEDLILLVVRSRLS